MPTQGQAIQLAAWEALVRIRHSEAAMARSRAFRFLPSRPSEGAELVQNLPTRDGDPSTPNLIAYVSAMMLLNNSLLSELAKIKGELARARMRLYVDKNLTVPSQPQTQAAGLQPANPGPSQPSTWGSHPQFPLPAQDALEPEIEASIAETIARV